MTKYMVLYLAPISAAEQMQNASPEEAQQVMALWGAWYEKNGAAIVDGGTPLGKGVNVSPAGSAAQKSSVAGYSVLQADDRASLEAALSDHPHLLVPGASIEVLEMMPIEM